MLVFKDPITAKLYEPLTDYDQWLEIPPDRKNECKCKAYVGWLSNITEHAAERYVASGGNLIKAIEFSAAAAPVIPAIVDTEES
jgi:hypothetical protein